MSTKGRMAVGPVTTEVAALLREAMGRRQMRQRDVAIKTNISTSQISRLLNGTISPNLEELIVICEAIGIRPEKVFSDSIRKSLTEGL